MPPALTHLELEATLSRIAEADMVRVEGRVESAVGLSVRAVIPGARIGDVVEVRRRGGEPLPCEVVGFSSEGAILIPYGPLRGVGYGDLALLRGESLGLRCGEDLLGRVLDGLGRPIDGGPPLRGEAWPVMRAPPPALSRPRVEAPLALGVRAIDGLMTVGRGQRLGLFAGSGVGKSTLLGQIARGAAADVVVVALVGERGREVRELLEDALPAPRSRRTVVVCATSDAPALVRVRAAWVATAIAEHFRERGGHVLLLLDSLTRFVRALREVGLAAGEPPARRGFPPSAFAQLPPLLERAGTSPRGSITAFYTVLVEGDDLTEPVADEVRGLLDGHLVLDRGVAARGRFPALDPLRSLSRVMSSVVDPAHQRAAREILAHLAIYEAHRDLIALGAYKPGSDPRLDEAIRRIDAIEAFLAQPKEERTELVETRRRMEALTR